MSNKLKKDKFIEENSFISQLNYWLGIIINILICAYMIFTIIVIPYYNKFTYRGIGTGKVNLFLDTITALSKIIIPIAAIYIITALHLTIKKTHNKIGPIIKNFVHSMSATDLFVFIYIIGVLLSYLLSDYRNEAFKGAAGWGMGALTQLFLACSYFFVSRLWKKRIFFPLLFIPVTAFLFVLSCLNRFGVYPVSMSNLDPQFLSFVGNINWFCGYMVMPIFGCACFVWCCQFTNHYLLFALKGYLFISFCALITNGSSSGILTLSGVFFLFFIMSCKNSNRMLAYSNLIVIFTSACMFILAVRLIFPDAITYKESVTEILTYSFLPCVLFPVSITIYLLLKRWTKTNFYPVKFFNILCRASVFLLIFALTGFVLLILLNTLHPGSIGYLSKFSVFTFSAEWGSRRGATWIAGLMTWFEQSPLKKLIGVGPDCMKSYIYTDGSEHLLNFCKSVWPNNTLTNSHCELLTVLVNTGAVGLISFTGILVSSIKRYFQYYFKNKSLESSLVISCGMCIIAYTIHNLVSFQQVLNEPTMFLLLGIGEAYANSHVNTYKKR